MIGEGGDGNYGFHNIKDALGDHSQSHLSDLFTLSSQSFHIHKSPLNELLYSLNQAPRHCQHQLWNLPPKKVIISSFNGETVSCLWHM